MKRKLAFLALFISVLAISLFVFRNHLTLNNLITYEQQLRQFLALKFLVAMVAGFFVYVILSLNRTLACPHRFRQLYLAPFL